MCFLKIRNLGDQSRRCNLSIVVPTDSQIQGTGWGVGGIGSGMKGKFGVSRFKILHFKCIDSDVLL